MAVVLRRATCEIRPVDELTVMVRSRSKVFVLLSKRREVWILKDVVWGVLLSMGGAWVG